MDMDIRVATLITLFLVFLFGGIFVAVSYDSSLENKQMQACVSQPNHEWVENNDGNMECRLG